MIGRSGNASSDQAVAPGSFLAVGFDEATRWLTPDDDLRIGRGTIADLRLDDDNQFLHRRLVRLWCDDDGIWHAANEGSRLSVRVCDADSAAERKTPPGGDDVVPYDKATLRVRAAQRDYVVDLRHGASPDDGAVMFAEEGFPAQLDVYDETPTLTRSLPGSSIAAHGDQLRLLLALSESMLLDPHARPELPTRARIGNRFGWTTKAVDRKLDRLCKRFASLGVDGLQGELGLNANDRMSNLARFAVDAGIVRRDDLSKLDSYA